MEKKLLRQWFIKTTEFSKQLYEGLDNEDLQGWEGVLGVQKNWIQVPNGVNFHLLVSLHSNENDNLCFIF